MTSWSSCWVVGVIASPKMAKLGEGDQSEDLYNTQTRVLVSRWNREYGRRTRASYRIGGLKASSDHAAMTTISRFDWQSSSNPTAVASPSPTNEPLNKLSSGEQHLALISQTDSCAPRQRDRASRLVAFPCSLGMGSGRKETRA